MCTLCNGDKISLLQQGSNTFTLQIEEEEPHTELEFEFDGDATQPNMDINYEDFKSPLTSPAKQSRDENGKLQIYSLSPSQSNLLKYPVRLDKHARKKAGVDLTEDSDSQNSELSSEMPGLNGTTMCWLHQPFVIINRGIELCY